MAIQSDSRFITRKYLLMAADLLVLSVSLLLYLKYFYYLDLWPRKTITSNPGWYVLLSALWLVYANLFKLYNTIYAPRVLTILKRTVVVAAATALTYLLIPYLSPVFPNSRLPFFAFIGQTIGIMTVWHIIFGKYLNKPVIAKRILIVGAGWAGKTISKTLKDQKVFDKSGYEVIGFIDDDPEKINKEFDGTKVLATSEELFTYSRRLKIDEIILAIHTAKSVNGKLYSHLINCENYGIPVTAVNLLYE
ncbi:MAG: hypothetical protein Salg2KO_20560 [Salibacteraceae bacterium]